MNAEASRGMGSRAMRSANRFFKTSVRLEEFCARRPWVLLLGVGVCSVLVQLVTRGAPRSWDWVWVSGMIAVSFGLPPAFRLGALTQRTLDRLADRGVLTGPTSDLAAQTARRGELIGRFAGPVLAALVLLVFLWTLVVPSTVASGPGVPDVGNNWLEILLGSVAAYFVGRAAGGVLATASLGNRIDGRTWTLQVQPGHVDGAAGMKPVGDLYFRQAMIVAIPAVWLIVVLCLKSLAVVGAKGWAAIGQVVGRVDGWGPWYFFLLVLAVVLEISAFIVPMVSFHRTMASQKRALEQAADQRSGPLHQLLEDLPEIEDDAARQSVENRISAIRELNSRIEQMPTWPVDASLRRRFTVRNALLLVPIVANAIGLAVESDSWNTLGDIFGQ